jgi:Domain of unknown function (DUF4434)
MKQIKPTHRFYLALIKVCVVCMALSACNVKTDSSTDVVALAQGPVDGYGIYEACDIRNKAAACKNNLTRMAAGGFKLVINYSQFVENYSEANVTAYLNKAAAVGMKVILAMKEEYWWDGTDLRDMFPKLAAKCNCADNEGFIQYIVKKFGSHPAVWGYYLGDETDVSQVNAWLPYARLVGETDPTRPRLMVYWAENDCCEPELNPNLLEFADELDVLSGDYYPIGRTDPPLPTSYVGLYAKKLRDAADELGKTAGIVLQSYALSQYDANCDVKPVCERFPTQAQLLAM